MDNYEDLKKWDDEEFRITNVNYLISNYGRVFSIMFKKPKEMSTYEQSKSRGYRRIKLRCGKKYKSFLVHRLVATSFIPNKLNKKQVNHINGIRDDNRVINLEWATSSENHKHAFSSGIRELKKGELNPNSKLNNTIVSRAKDMMRKGFTVAHIARSLNVSAQSLYKVKSGDTWSHIK